MLEVLRLSDFRPFRALEFRPGPAASFVMGGNGQGKTSLLEAAGFLLRLQSPRTTSPSECMRFGAAGFGLEGEFAGRSLRVSFAGRLRRAWLDGKPPGALAEYLSVGRAAWISNGDIELVAGGGVGRRRFLDFLGSQTVPGYLARLRSYERALRSRNLLLREGRPRREVAAFDEALSAAGDFLLAAREELLRELIPLCAAACRDIAGGGELSLIYQPGASRPMARALQASRGEEERLRATAAGPHRDDIALLLDDKPAAAFASEGQQRSIALALKLAQARLIGSKCGAPPLCLVDDVFGELDISRRNNLLAALPAGAQCIITATSLDWMRARPPEARFFRLEGGRLEAVQD
ncbi:MAG: DNA replication and repair protein RecF [Terrimicrobiaceae bacterium]|nr:DNA replication and repair protein RecF [Terrimicrobiaceae bacterium]